MLLLTCSASFLEVALDATYCTGYSLTTFSAKILVSAWMIQSWGHVIHQDFLSTNYS